MTTTNPYIHTYYVNLRNGADIRREKKPLASGDKNADVFLVHLQDGGKVVSLDGAAVTGKVIRADGQTVPLAGSVAEGAAKITLDESCYAVPGEIKLTVTVSAGDVVQSVLIVTMDVQTSETGIVVDNGVIGTLSELLAEIENMRTATQEARETVDAANTALDKTAADAQAAIAKAIRDTDAAVTEIREVATQAAPPIVVEADGALVTIGDGGARPVVRLVSSIAAVQAGSGEPSPENVRAITGWDAVRVWRTGRNLLDASRWSSGTTSGVTLTNNGDGSVTVTGTNTAASVANLSGAIRLTLKPGTYTVSGGGSTAEGCYSVVTYRRAGAVSFAYGCNTFEIDAEQTVTCVIQVGVGATVDVTLWPMIEAGGSASAFEPYQVAELTAALPETVYGGHLDWVTGVLTVTHGHIAAYAGETVPDGWISSVGALTNGAQVVYPLAEPYTIQLDPQTLDMLKGNNTVWSDCGDTAVSYVVDTKTYVDAHAVGGSGGAVASVNGKTGAVVLNAADVGAMPADAQIVDADAREQIAGLSEEKVSKNGVNEVTKENVDFVEKLAGTNLFNEATMATVMSWFYWDQNNVGTGVGKEVFLITNSNTKAYSAIEIPISKSGDITIQMGGAAKIFAYFFTDENNIAIAFGAAIMAELSNGYTVTAPDGAKKLLLSILQYEGQHAGGNKLMVNYGASAAPWEAYGDRYVFEGVEYEDKRVDAAVSIVGDKNNAVSIKLPEQYALVVGDTFELFYKGIVNAVNPDLFDVRVICAKGNAYTKRYVWTPTAADVGSHALTVELYGINHNLLATKTIQLVVKNKATSPAAPVNVLCVGDSLTTGGTWVAEFQRRLIETGGTPAGDGLTNINFIGTRDNGTVRYEGYGGWKFESYVTENVSFNARIITCAHDKDEAVDQHSVYRDSAGVQWKIETVYDDSIFIIAVSGEGREFPESGTLTWVSGGTNHADIVYTASEKAPGNPFWNAETGKMDIAAYAERLGVSSIDYVYVLLGWNDAAKNEEDYKLYATKFIQYFRNYNDNIKIVYMGLQIPARDGLGANYGANGTYADYYGLMQYVFNVDKWYSDLKSQNPYNLTTVNIAGQFDTEHNSITATRPVNVRSTETETYQSNGVHPAKSGYMQIADAVYRDLTHKLQS